MLCMTCNNRIIVSQYHSLNDDCMIEVDISTECYVCKKMIEEKVKIEIEILDKTLDLKYHSKECRILRNERDNLKRRLLNLEFLIFSRNN